MISPGRQRDKSVVDYSTCVNVLDVGLLVVDGLNAV